MTAFGLFVHTYAIWLYLLGALGILVGIKMLVDARRLARTTLFSLDQERAGERTFRAVMLIIALVVAIGAITAVNVFIYPVTPVTESPILRGATATLVAMIFPSSTPTASVTPTLIQPTETPFYTPTPTVSTPTRAPVKATAVPPTPMVAPVFPLAAPKLAGPPNGDVQTGSGRANADLTFKWDWSCTGCELGPNDRFVITITYIDKTSGRPNSIGAGPRENNITMAAILRGYPYDVWQQAKGDAFQWSVQVKRGEQALTPPSETWKFVWH